MFAKAKQVEQVPRKTFGTNTATCSFFQDQLSSARARAYHLAAPTPANVFQGHFAQYLSDPKALPTVKLSRFDIYSNVETQTLYSQSPCPPFSLLVHPARVACRKSKASVWKD